MNTPMITWCAIIALFVVILIVKIVNTARSHTGRRHNFLEIGKESEEVYMPGDEWLFEDHDVKDEDY